MLKPLIRSLPGQRASRAAFARMRLVVDRPLQVGRWHCMGKCDSETSVRDPDAVFLKCDRCGGPVKWLVPESDLPFTK